MAGTRAQANRLADPDHANLVRTSRAAHVQLEAIRRLEERHESLSDELEAAAGLRSRYPTLSLQELASRGGLTKATLARRLAQVVSLANE